MCNIFNSVLFMPIVPTNLKLNGATSATGRQPSQPSGYKTVRHKYGICGLDRYPLQKQYKEQTNQKHCNHHKSKTATQPGASPCGPGVFAFCQALGQTNDNTHTLPPCTVRCLRRVSVQCRMPRKAGAGKVNWGGGRRRLGGVG